LENDIKIRKKQKALLAELSAKLADSSRRVMVAPTFVI